jgi:hypothetical protein
MFWLQSIHRHRDAKQGHRVPMYRDRAEGAGDQQHRTSAAIQFGQYFLEFAKAYERVASDKRDVQRPIFVDQAKSALHQVAPLEVCQLSKCDTRKA